MKRIVDKQVIREFSGKIIGWIETDDEGNRIVREFSGKILGKYDKKFNVTRDFFGRIISKGDQSSLLIGLNKHNW